MSSKPSRIAELAAIVSQNTQKIDEHLTTHGLPYPAFDANAPVDLNLCWS